MWRLLLSALRDMLHPGYILHSTSGVHDGSNSSRVGESYIFHFPEGGETACRKNFSSQHAGKQRLTITCFQRGTGRAITRRNNQDSFARMSESNQPESTPHMKLSKKLFAAAAMLVVSCCLSAPEAFAQAGFITGKVNFNGAATLDSTNLATATRVVSWSDTETTGGNTGSFSGVTNNVPVTFFAPWNFNSGPIMNFWSFNSPGGNFRFDLTASTISSQNSMFLTVSGTGFIRGTNSMGDSFTPTAGNWAFTIQDSSSGGGATFTFSFSADTSAVVPEGGSALALLGIGLVAVEAIRRKLASA